MTPIISKQDTLTWGDKVQFLIKVKMLSPANKLQAELEMHLNSFKYHTCEHPALVIDAIRTLTDDLNRKYPRTASLRCKIFFASMFPASMHIGIIAKPHEVATISFTRIQGHVAF